MEENMNVYQDSGDINVMDVLKLLATLYNSRNPAEQAEANNRLTELQSSETLWRVCWPLLDPNLCESVEVHFFAANALLHKINQGWSEMDEEWLKSELRPKLVETLVSYASSPRANRVAIERLSLALATFALHSIPTFWPDAIENILQTFTPQNLRVSISAERLCDILLKILMFIPEEYAVLMPQIDHRAKLNAQITNSGPLVFKFLHSLLLGESSLNSLNSDTKQTVLKCLTSWTLHSRTSLLEVEDSQPLMDLVYELTRDPKLCGSACATLAATFSNQKAENYRNAIIDFLPKLSNLRQVIEEFIKDDKLECAIKIYSLIINFSENHSRILLRIVLDDGIQYDRNKYWHLHADVRCIIQTILDCTSAPGVYGIDEKYSDMSFPFWFTFFENFCYYSDSCNDLICKTFDPLVDSLLQALITKARYPSYMTYYQEWTDDERESYRCYRQDLGDNISLIVQFPRSRDRILASLHGQLAQRLSDLLGSPFPNEEKPWQALESIAFALKSIAESIPYDETKYVPKVFAILSQIPFNDHSALLYCTVAELISAYSDWLFTQSTHLAIAFNILFLGISSRDPHVRLMSTLSLKDLTSECQTVLHPFAQQIVKSCTDAVLQLNTSLSTNEKSRLMHTIGTTLAMSPAESVVQSLNTLTMPLLCELNSKAQADPAVDPTCHPVILDRLTMLNSLIESLYVKQYSGNEYELDGDENDIRQFDPARFDTVHEVEAIQPVLSLLKQLIPIISLISIKYQSDEDVMGNISNTIKRSAKSLGIEVKPIVKDLLMIIVNAYDPILSSNVLEGGLPLYMLFKVDQSLHQLLMDAFAEITDKTLKVCIGNPLRQLSLTLENYFRFATSICKKFPAFLTDQKSSVNVEYVYKLAIASLELPEKRTLAEVCSFLSLIKKESVGVEHLHTIFVSQLDMMLSNIFNIFGGNYSTPRNAIDHVVELLFTVIDMDEVKAPLKLIVDKDDFPTKFIKRDQKANFVSRIYHEKNRKKFKDACSELVLIVRNLNRPV